MALSDTDLDALFDGPSSAVITTARRDGSALTSPVWVRRAGDRVEIVMAATDGKVANLRRDARCCVVVFEAVPPFRAAEICADATVESRSDVSEVRRSIASRYLGDDAASQFAESRATLDSVVVSVPMSAARTWDLRQLFE